jgi:hypothetical protein
MDTFGEFSVRENSSFWVNFRGHFLMVITNGANAGGAGAKPLLGLVNTVQLGLG